MDKSIQEKFVLAIDERIKEAGRIMDLGDLTDEEADNQEIQDTVYEERFHCGVCIVRTVMETVWPSIEEYIDYLEGTIRGYEQMTKASHTALKPLITTVGNVTRDTIIAVLADLNTPPEPIALPDSQ